MTPADRSEIVRRLALECGFDAVGIAPVAPPAHAAYYRDWLARGHAGQMRYLHTNAQLRERPEGILPDARSVVCVALVYKRPAETAEPGGVADPAEARGLPEPFETGGPDEPAKAGGPDGSADAADPSQPTGRVAQYARGVDYHRVLRRRLGFLEAAMRDWLDEPFAARACVDTAPVIERELAAAAGLGWIGKNTMLLSRGLGSFTFLGELFTTLELAPDTPQTDHCGTCTRCLDACPTAALVAPYQMDASRCISYLTIELRGDMPAELAGDVGDWVYGCDACQDVCPFNRRAPEARDPEIRADRVPARLPLLPLLELRSGDYRRLTRDSATRRATRLAWRRNAAVALQNARRAADAPAQSPRSAR